MITTQQLREAVRMVEEVEEIDRRLEVASRAGYATIDLRDADDGLQRSVCLTFPVPIAEVRKMLLNMRAALVDHLARDFDVKMEHADRVFIGTWINKKFG